VAQKVNDEKSTIAPIKMHCFWNVFSWSLLPVVLLRCVWGLDLFECILIRFSQIFSNFPKTLGDFWLYKYFFYPVFFLISSLTSLTKLSQYVHFLFYFTFYYLFIYSYVYTLFGPSLPLSPSPLASRQNLFYCPLWRLNYF
jgi:hypothetical protein